MTNPGKLADIAVDIACLSAREYLRIHKLEADPDALAACIKSWVKIKLPEALADAKEATFKASLMQAGIEAAKEASIPPARGCCMSRLSGDELAEDGTILNGYDYNVQVWVMAGRVMRCGHPSHFGNVCDLYCNAAKYRGQLIRDVEGHEVRRLGGAV